jgi:putative cell wall-binding protein
LEIILVLGSTSAVSEAVQREVATLIRACDGVRRLAGPSRFETAATVAEYFFSQVPVVFVATGTNFPDALAGGPLALYGPGPMLLVHHGGVPPAAQAALAAMQPETIVLLGGPGAIPPAVEAQLVPYAPEIVRIAGIDRFATAAEISSVFRAPTDTVFVATGSNFPDALAGAAAAGRTSSPLLLVADDHVPQVVLEELRRLSPSKIVILGGHGAVPDTVVDQLLRY